MQYIYALDQPPGLNAPGGVLSITGWIGGWEQPPAIRLQLGHNFFDCETGITRPDVAEAHPSLLGANHSGFRLNTVVPAGFHVGTLEHRAPQSDIWTPFHTLSIIAETSPLVAQLESPRPIDGANFWTIRGWCFHPQSKIESLVVQFAGQEITLRAHLPRPDVAQSHAQFPTAALSGFSGDLPLRAGHGPVILHARLDNGSSLRHVLLPQLEIANPSLLASRQAASKARAARIRLPHAARPQVSIVIPIYNQLDLTLDCIRSIVRYTRQTSFEVIVIDDKSDFFVRETLQQIPNLRLFSNTENRGFILNCNHGAAQARGEFIAFLNNDTEVTPGWIESLQQTLATRPEAGAVGAKLIYPSGQLQDAGGLIWSDGTCWNFGKGDDPDRPEYNYVREVDYVTGACILMRRDLFLRVGGFDERYCPAYYEDADLAFKIRAAGLRVYYQPDAKIIHFEGISSGKTTTHGVKRHQLANQEKFSAKWAGQLGRYGDGSYLSEVARDRYCAERILVIDACALTPDMDAGSLRMFNMLIILANEGKKVVFAAENLQFHEPFSTQLRQAGVEHLGVPHCASLERHIEDFGYSYDLVIISRKAIAARFLPVVRNHAPRAKIVFDTVDLMFVRFARQAALEKSAELQLMAEKSKAQELELVRQADMTYVVSEDEAAILTEQVAAAKLAVVPLINPTRISNRPFEARRGILFVGGYQHPPNLDAILFFLDEILPLVQKSIPEIDVHIVGSRTPPQLMSRAGKTIHIHGFVPDMDPLLDSVRLSIAPLRFGAGVKGKINQSMACGVPAIGTTIAVEGMHLTTGENCLVADTPEDFADAVCRLHSNAELWQRLSTAGIAHVERYFSFARVRTQLNESFARLGLSTARQRLELPARPVADFPMGKSVVCNPEGDARRFLIGGWDNVSTGHHWSIAKRARLRFRVTPSTGEFRLTAKLFPFLVEGKVLRQRLEITSPALGETVSEALLESGINSVQFCFTLEERHQGVVDLEWKFPDAVKPVSLGISEDERWLAVGLVEFSIIHTSP